MPDMLASFKDFTVCVVLVILLLVAISNGPEDPNPPAGSSPAVAIPYPHLLTPNTYARVEEVAHELRS